MDFVRVFINRSVSAAEALERKMGCEVGCE